MQSRGRKIKIKIDCRGVKLKNKPDASKKNIVQKKCCCIA
jgi:hypothetical protein